MERKLRESDCKRQQPQHGGGVCKAQPHLGLLIQSSSAFPSSLPLQEIEEKQINPELYPYGSRGPVGAHYLAAKYGVRWGDIVNVDEHTEDRL